MKKIAALALLPLALTGCVAEAVTVAPVAVRAGIDVYREIKGIEQQEDQAAALARHYCEVLAIEPALVEDAEARALAAGIRASVVDRAKTLIIRDGC